MHRTYVKNRFKNVMILQRELCLCNFHIIYKFLCDPGGGAFASSQCPHSGKFDNFIKGILLTTLQHLLKM